MHKNSLFCFKKCSVSWRNKWPIRFRKYFCLTLVRGKDGSFKSDRNSGNLPFCPSERYPDSQWICNERNYITILDSRFWISLHTVIQNFNLIVILHLYGNHFLFESRCYLLLFSYIEILFHQSDSEISSH